MNQSLEDRPVMVCPEFKKDDCPPAWKGGCKHRGLHYENEKCKNFGPKCPVCREATIEELVLARMTGARISE